jgi:hypothetical protein
MRAMVRNCAPENPFLPAFEQHDGFRVWSFGPSRNDGELRMYSFIPATEFRPSYEKSPAQNRGRRESRVRQRTRSLACKSKKHASKSPQVRRNIRPSLRNGFNGFLRALPGEPGLLSPYFARIPREITPASGRQDHTTSPSAFRVARLAPRARNPFLRSSWSRNGFRAHA